MNFWYYLFMNGRQIAGKNVRELRKMQGYSLDEFAEYAQINWSYVASIERGDINLTIDTIEKLATALRVPMHVLLTEGAYKWLKPASDTVAKRLVDGVKTAPAPAVKKPAKARTFKKPYKKA